MTIHRLVKKAVLATLPTAALLFLLASDAAAEKRWDSDAKRYHHAESRREHREIRFAKFDKKDKWRVQRERARRAILIPPKKHRPHGIFWTKPGSRYNYPRRYYPGWYYPGWQSRNRCDSRLFSSDYRRRWHR